MRVERLLSEPDGRILPPALGGGLTQGALRIWSVDLDSIALPWALTLLSEAERGRVAGSALPERGRRYGAAHASLRVLLAACAGIGADRLVFESGAHGKPRLAGGSGLRFSLSHSSSEAVIGVSRGGEIGVDLERIRADLDCERLARRILSPAEAVAWAQVAQRTAVGDGPASLEEETRRGAFFAVWVRKEAYAKARGEGVARGLASFAVTIGLHEAPRLITDQRDPRAPEHWTLHDLELAAGYAGAVAIEQATCIE